MSSRCSGAVVPSLSPSTGPVSPQWAQPAEPVEDVVHRNKGRVLTRGREAPVELGTYVCRAKTLHTLSGLKQTQETPHYTCALGMLGLRG